MHHSINLLSGDDFELVVRWQDADENAIPIDTARLQVRATAAAAEPLIDLSEDLTVVGGEITLTMDGTRTAEVFEAVGTAQAVWDLEATAETGVVKTLVGGRFRVTQDVTR